MRAAVIGASGMGKHHAKWLLQAGCELVAFAGSSEATVARTKLALQDALGFAGRGYTSVAELLDREQPDCVAVCSPAELHYEHALAALHAGAHVMCEKPLVYDETLPAEKLLAQGAELVAAAQELERALAVNTQYAAGVAPYYELTGLSPDDPPREFFMQMESKPKTPRQGEAIWVDLSPHPISVLLAFCPDGQADWETASCEVSEARVDARFRWGLSRGTACDCHLVTRNTPPEESIRRAWGINGVVVEYEGRNDERGVYAAYLRRAGREVRAQDFVHTSLARFVDAAQGRGEPLVTGALGLKNLEVQLRLHDLARQRSGRGQP